MKNIPVLTVTGKTIAETYEKALVELYDKGCRFKTQYDKPEDPESIDATMNITIEEPLTDPMIHKAFPGSISDLREYVMELQGVKDHWCKNLNDPKDTRWEYTYYQRFVQYGSWREKHENVDIDGIPHGWTSSDKGFKVDQIEAMIDKLCNQPFSRQCQAITWMPNIDLDIYDPPCLQSLWARVLEDEDGVWWLNYNIRIRSNAAFSAYLMNVFGLTLFTKEIIADEIAKRTGKVVKLGRLNWQADSWHIYGKEIKEFEERFLKRLGKTEFEDRIYNFYDSMIQEMYYEEDENIKNKIAIETEKMKD